jgi:hypothetical protein
MFTEPHLRTACCADAGHQIPAHVAHSCACMSAAIRCSSYWFSYMSLLAHPGVCHHLQYGVAWASTLKAWVVTLRMLKSGQR